MPPKDALDSFCGLAVNLDPELVVPVLLQQLGPDAEHAGSWQAKSKALAVMGALLKTEGCEGHADLMREAVADVAALSNAKPVTLGAKAKKLVKGPRYYLRELGIPELPENAPKIELSVRAVREWHVPGRARAGGMGRRRRAHVLRVEEPVVDGQRLGPDRRAHADRCPAGPCRTATSPLQLNIGINRALSNPKGGAAA